jgi:spore coat protein U-like protein
MSKQWVTRLSLVSAILAAPGMALGDSSSAYVPVTATVSQSCTISTVSALAFATYDPIGTNATAALNANGQISIACSKGAIGLTIGMDNGTHAAGTQRQMLGGNAKGFLVYNVFQPPGNAPNTACTYPGSTAWTAAGAGLLTLTASPAKTARLYNVCGSIPGGQDVAADTYTDIVGATLNF